MYSAPQSVYLLGEEGILFGKPALACAIDQRVLFILTEGKKTVNDEKVDFMSKQVLTHLSRKNIPFSSVPYTWDMRDAHDKKTTMWSSAHIVSACAAFLEFYSGHAHDAEVVNNLAYKLEKQYDPQAYGVLTSASTFGGLIFFRKEFAFLKGIYKLPFKIPPIIQEQLFLIGKIPFLKVAKKMKTFTDYYSKNPKQGDRILSIMEKSVKQLTIAIAKEDPVFFKEAALQYRQALEKALNLPMNFVYNNMHAPYMVCFADEIKSHLSIITLFKQAHEGVRREKSV